jgi:hypothetical protein
MGKMKLLNEDAIKKIAENFKNIIDGGNKEMKNSMDTFDKLSNEISEKSRKINKLAKKYNEE